MRDLHLLILICLALNCSSVPEQNWVAKVGSRTITKDEFELRLQFNAHLTHIDDPSLVKSSLLDALIAERILALDAITLHHDTLNTFIQLNKQFQREAIIENWWEKYIFKNISISEAELIEKYNLSRIKKIFRFASFSSKQEAGFVLSRIKSLNELAGLPEYSASDIVTDTISWGNGPPEIESELYQVSPGEVAGPIQLGYKFFIIELIEEISMLGSSTTDFLRNKHQLKKILKRRKGNNLFHKKAQGELKQYIPRLHKDIFKKLVEKLEKKMFPGGFESGSIEELSLPKNKLNLQIVVEFNDGDNWTVRQLLSRLAVSPYPIKKGNPAVFRNSIIIACKAILDDEVVVKDAIDKGIDNLKAVRYQTEMWSDAYLAQIMSAILFKKLGDKHTLTNYILNHELYPKVIVNSNLIDTLHIKKTDMIVIKTHFPTRTIAPPIQPLLLR